MPSNLLTADTMFPNLECKRTDEKFDVLTNYLYMLLEQLRYTLGNLGIGNFNSDEFLKIGKTITDPIYAQLEDDEGNLTLLQATAQGLASRVTSAEGNISTLAQTATSLTSQISDVKGNVSTLQQTATSLTSQISSINGNISTLQQTADGLITRVGTVEGNYSTLQQTVGSITLSVSNDESSSVIKLMVNGVAVASKTITFTGAVTFTDLETAGATTIHGGNIDTGTLEVSNLYGEKVYLRTSSGNVSGYFTVTDADTADYAIDLTSNGALRLSAVEGDVYIENGAGAYLQIEHNNFSPLIVAGGADLVPNQSNHYCCGDSTHLWSDVYASNGTIQTSDLTLKKDVTYGLDAYDVFFDGLQPMSYRFIDGHERLHHGLGAQDVEKLLADCGLTSMDFAGFIKSPKMDDAGEVVEGEYIYALRYTEFIPLLIEQVQKLKIRVNELEGKLS